MIMEHKMSGIGEIKLKTYELAKKYNMSHDDVLDLVEMVEQERDRLDEIRHAVHEIMQKII